MHYNWLDPERMSTMKIILSGVLDEEVLESELREVCRDLLGESVESFSYTPRIDMEPTRCVAMISSTVSGDKQEQLEEVLLGIFDSVEIQTY